MSSTATTHRPPSVLVLAGASFAVGPTLHPTSLQVLAGRPALHYVLDAVLAPTVERVVVVVDGVGDAVEKQLGHDARVVVANQPMGGGTADAAAAGLRPFADDLDEDDLLVVGGDLPLLEGDTVAGLVDVHRRGGAALTLLTVDAAASPEAARVVRGRDAEVARLVDVDAVEAASCDTAASGIFCVRRSLLGPALRRLRSDPFGSPLDGVVEVLASAGHRIGEHRCVEADEVLRIRSRASAADIEARLRQRINARWMQRGVAMLDPARTLIDATVQLGADVRLLPGVLLEGRTVVGAGSEVGPDCHLVDTVVGAGSRVATTTAADAEIGDDATVGPYAVLAPGSVVASASDTGPFYDARSDRHTQDS